MSQTGDQILDFSLCSTQRCSTYSTEPSQSHANIIRCNFGGNFTPFCISAILRDKILRFDPYQNIHHQIRTKNVQQTFSFCWYLITEFSSEFSEVHIVKEKQFLQVICLVNHQSIYEGMEPYEFLNTGNQKPLMIHWHFKL